MNVRSAGLKFKIATNFIWRVGHGVHHRDSTLPPYGWSSHEVNSERLFFSSIRRVERRGLIRREKNQVLFFSKKRELICPLPTQSKSVTSNKHDPICAILVQRVPSISLTSRISWTNVEPTSKHDPLFAMSVQSKYSVCFS